MVVATHKIWKRRRFYLDFALVGMISLEIIGSEGSQGSKGAQGNADLIKEFEII